MACSRKARLAALGVGVLGIVALVPGWLPAPAQTTRPATAYVDPRTCAACHREIWETYRQTGMGRAFYKPTEATAPEGSYYHQPSDSYFTMLRKDGKLFQRRHQRDVSGREINVFEKQVDFVMGSGNHARTYLHRTPRGALLELPLGWYAEKGGLFAMNPGYDRPDHDGFRRKITYGCMFCHNGYPKIPADSDQSFAEPAYAGPLPEGIDCQRCHGPAAQHVLLAGSGKATGTQIRQAIVNPAKLPRERREEVCIQCHLESTSFPLPNSIQRYGKGPFDYRPGQPLGDHWLFFDHAPGTGREDKFEIVNAVYRMRKSACYLQSKGALECASCHNPHDAPRGERATQHYDAACRKCHATDFDRKVAAGQHTDASSCADCHMPKRRTEDVIHSLATDHLVQRRPPAGDLLAEREERHEEGERAYRGEVALYYPPKLAPIPESELYLALAQVIERSNLTAGIPRLAQALQKAPNARSEFHLALGEAWRNSGRLEKALLSYREAARRNPKSVFMQWKLGAALRHANQLPEAASVLQRAAMLDPKHAGVWHEIGLTLQAQGKIEDGIQALAKAIELDPDAPEPHNNLGNMRLESGDPSKAEASFREAIRIQPDYADAHGNLAALLAGTGDFSTARQYFETALRLRPADARTRYNFAMALGRARQYEDAQRQLEEAVRVEPAFVDAQLLLADLLLARDQFGAAAEHYLQALKADANLGRAQLGLGRALLMAGDRTSGIESLRKAATAADPAVRESAAALLKQLGTN